MEKNKGDLWEFEMEEFDFPGNCITMSSIEGVTIDEGGNDAWNIDTVVTIVREEEKSTNCLLLIFMWTAGLMVMDRHLITIMIWPWYNKR